MNNTVFFSQIFDQKRAVEKLVEESRTDIDFYVFLGMAVFITTLGLLLDNPVVVVGAMLVAPILFPILALGLGIVTTSGEAIVRAIFILVRSIAVAVVVSFLTSFLIQTSSLTEQLRLLAQPDLFTFFLISFAAGIVASFAWVKQDTARSLPGVAISVSLVPPLSAVGLALALFSRELLVGSALLFLTNTAGVVVASLVVFSLFGFSRARVWQEKEIRKEEIEVVGEGKESVPVAADTGK